jgi:dihydrofolate reductase
MRRVIAFNTVSLDGYFSGPNGDLSWAHNEDDEWRAFTDGNAKGEGTFLFGRVTYELMASFWPTPAAMKQYPVVARSMNGRQKVVFSRTLQKVTWKNTELVREAPAEMVRRMKDGSGPGMVILGSGSLVSQLAQEGLIDEFQIVVCPVAIGKGRTMFDGIRDKVQLRLVQSRVFGNGNVFVCYEPKA